MKRKERYKKKIALFLVNTIFKGCRPAFFPIKRWILNLGGFSVGDGTKIVGPLFCTGDFSIGKDSWVGRNCSIDGNGKVRIGDKCDIGPNVQFYTGTHMIGTEERRAGKGYNGEIVIGDGCWLCATSKFLANTSIGKANVVAAGAVICSSFDDNNLIGGIPGKRIKKYEDDELKCNI